MTQPTESYWCSPSPESLQHVPTRPDIPAEKEDYASSECRSLHHAFSDATEALRGVIETVRLSSIKTPLFLPSLVVLINILIIPILQPWDQSKSPFPIHQTPRSQPFIPAPLPTPKNHHKQHEIPHPPPPRPHRHHRPRHARPRRRPGIPLPRSPRRHARKTHLVQTPPPLPPGSGRHLRRYAAGEFLQWRVAVYGALPRGELCVVLYSVSLVEIWGEVGGNRGGGRGKERKGEGEEGGRRGRGEGMDL